MAVLAQKPPADAGEKEFFMEKVFDQDAARRRDDERAADAAAARDAFWDRQASQELVTCTDAQSFADYVARQSGKVFDFGDGVWQCKKGARHLAAIKSDCESRFPDDSRGITFRVMETDDSAEEVKR